MSTSKIETTQGLCTVALTKHLMASLSLSEDAAFAKLMQMELYSLLMDPETRLYLETNEYLCEACDQELSLSLDGLYRFINEA